MTIYRIIEKVAAAMHCNLKAADVAPVIPALIKRLDKAPAYIQHFRHLYTFFRFGDPDFL